MLELKKFYCVYNKDSNTLRIETEGSTYTKYDKIVFVDDGLTVKVFISYICKQYPANGNNSTHLSYKDVKAIHKDINGYLETFDTVAESFDFDDLITDDSWRV